MSTHTVGVGSVHAPNRLGRIAGMVFGIAIAISIGIGIAQSESQDLTLDRFHPGHPTVAEDRQERIAELRWAEHHDSDPKRTFGPGQ